MLHGDVTSRLVIESRSGRGLQNGNRDEAMRTPVGGGAGIKKGNADSYRTARLAALF